MPKFRLQGFQSIANDGDGSSTSSGFLPNATGVALAAEATRQFKDYGAHTYEDLYANVTAFAGGDTVTMTFAENGTGSSNLTVAASGTGIVRDGTGTEVATANDLISCDHIDDGGMHSDAHTVQNTGVVASGGVAGIVGGSMVSVANTVGYIGLWSENHNTTVATSASRLSRDVTVNNLRVYATTSAGSVPISAHEATAGASSNVTVTITGTGATEDTTGTEAYSSGDDVGVKSDGSSGNSVTPQVVQMDTDVDEVIRGGLGGKQILAQNNFIECVSGRNTGSTSDTSGMTKHDTRIGVEDVANLHVFVSAVSSPTTARFGPKLNADAVSTNVQVNPTGTGLFSDETGVETLAEDDEIGFFGDTASGNFTFQTAYIEMPSTSTGASVTISGVVAAADAASPLATITSVGTISVAGEPATAPAAALLPAIEIGIIIVGEPATAPAVAELATVSTIEIVSVAGEVAAAPAVAELATITSSQILSIAGEPATADADVLLAAVEIGVTISGVVAEAPAVAELATITAVTDAVISGVTAEAPAVAELATITTVRIVLIAGEVAAAPAVAELATVTSVEIISIAGEPATADADALLATITATSGAITVSPPTITATAAALLPTITTVRIVSIAGVVAEAPAEAPLPAVEIAISIAGEPAEAPAVAELATITSTQIVAIAGETATAPAVAELATITSIGIVSIAGETATAPAAVPLAAVEIAITISGEPATADAAAPLATIATVNTVTINGEVAAAPAAVLLASILTLQFLRPASTSAAGNWVASATTLHGDTSDQSDATWAELSDGNDPSTKILVLETANLPNDSSPGGTLRVRVQRV